MKTTYSLLVVAVALLLSPAQALAQYVHTGNQTGLPPFGTFHGSNFDAVSMQNGNLHIEIPLVSAKQRGRTFTRAYVYDIPTFDIVWYPPPDPWQEGFWVVNPTDEISKWRISGSPGSYAVGYAFTEETCVNPEPDYNYFVRTNYAVWAPDGAKHPTALRFETSTYCTGNTLSAPTLDGIGMMVDISQDPPKITLKDGTQVSSFWRDSNGNLAGPLDMMNRDLLVVALVPNANCSPAAYRCEEWTVRNSSGASQIFRVEFHQKSIQTSACSTEYTPGTCYEYSGTWLLPVKLTLPNGKFYQFNWTIGGFGDLTSIDLPTGGRIEYTYTTNRYDSPDGGRYAPVTARRAVATRKVTNGAVSHTWKYTHDGWTTVRDPLGNEEVHENNYIQVGSMWSDSTMETKVRSYQGCSAVSLPDCPAAGALLRTVTKDYSGELNPQTNKLGNIRQIRETVTLESGQKTKTETDFETFTYVFNMGELGTGTFTATRLNPTERREYAFGPTAPGALVRKTSYSLLHTGNSNYLSRNIVDRVTATITRDGGGAIKAQSTNEYDVYTLGIAPSGAIQHDASFGTGFLYRGNVTAIRRWRNTDGAWLETRNQYDDLGNILSTKDPLNHTTTFSYVDSWANSACAPAGQGRIYLTEKTNALGHSESSTYNSCTGTLASSTDSNSQTTVYTYDYLDRSDVTTIPGGGEIDLDYDDDARVVTKKTKRTPTPLTYIVAKMHYDVLGRVWRDELCEDGSPACTQSIKTDTTFDGLGRKETVTNPYRSMAESTYGVTKFKYDALGRTTRLIPPDGNEAADTNLVKTEYCGNATKVIDQVGKWRRSVNDAQGRLIEVHEPNSPTATAGACVLGTDPVAKTLYTYDVLNNLLTVVQSTSRNRTFTYNSLSQLTQAGNPESGTISHTYDNDGNVLTKISPKQNQTSPTVTVTATHTYDVLHRLLTKSYNDGTTPAVSTFYDGTAPTVSGCTPSLGITNGNGRRTAMCDGAGFSAWSYDETGDILAEQRMTNGVIRSTAYAYNEDGSTKSIVYPTGQQIDYSYDATGRATSAAHAGGGTIYSSNGIYSPAGALCSVQLGTAIVATTTFNNRLQPLRMHTTSSSAPATPCDSPATTANILDYAYTFVDAAGKNNGNVIQIANGITPDRTQSFTYDELNRIKTAQSQATAGSHDWGLSFGYDIWANLLSATVTKGDDVPALSVGVSSSNKINTVTGMDYDAAGNVWHEPGKTYTYDAENRLINVAGVTYSYDGDGRRVQKSNGKLYWYGISADALVETNLSGAATDQFIFFGGERIARSKWTWIKFNIWTWVVSYYISDHLGSSRVVTSSTGTIVDDSDFYPFGGERVVTANTDNNYLFTGKERDAESGLDFFIARYYSSQYGRFFSPDEFTGGPVEVFSPNDPLPTSPLPYADIRDPQSLNKYTYTYNDPLNFVDPNGHCVGTGREGPCFVEQQMAQEQQAVEGRDGASVQSGETLLQNPPGQEDSQTNLAKRERVAALIAEKYNGSKTWAFDKKKGDHPAGTNKCSQCVNDVVKEAGAQARVTLSDGTKRPPTAGEWANPTGTIKNWRVLGPNESPKPGDVAAYRLPNPVVGATGHVGIVIKGPNGAVRDIAAHRNRVGPPMNQFRDAAKEGLKVVYRRFTGG